MAKTVPVLATSGTLTVSEIAGLTEGWMLDGEIRQLTRRTLEVRKRFIGKFLWFLCHRGFEHVGTPELRALLAYVSRGHEEPGGRWGNPRLTDPVRPRTVESWYDFLHAFYQ